MNIKLLKFSVIFMGMLIIIGIIILAIAIFFKFQNLANQKNIKKLFIYPPDQMNYKGHNINSDHIFISYENSEKLMISVYNIKSGENIKKIEILK